MKLSVCIPTYNFGRFIGQTLDSILPQVAGDDVEVVVVDGASTDDTADIVRDRMSRHARLRYERLAQKGGIDADIANTMRLARSDWVWLFSADDLMAKGALAKALSTANIDARDDVILCSHSECTLDMRPLWLHPVFKRDVPRRADLADGRARSEWIAAAATTEALFSFMGSLIIRRDTWLSVENGAPFDEMMGSCWAHVARLLTIAERRPLLVRFVAEPWVARRGENDSFSSQGRVKRMALSVDGFLRIAARFFGATSQEAAHVRRMLRKELPLPTFLDVRRDAREDSRELERLFDAIYTDVTPKSLAVRALYRATPDALAEPVMRSYWLAQRARRFIEGRGVGDGARDDA